MTPAVLGPRGGLYLLTRHARDRWAERLGLGDEELAHAVRFGRVAATRVRRGARERALWYAPEWAALVCREAGPVWVVATCYDYSARSGTGGFSGRLGTAVGEYVRRQADTRRECVA